MRFIFTFLYLHNITLFLFISIIPGIEELIESSFPETEEMPRALLGMGIPFPCSARLRSELLSRVREERESPRRLEEQLDAELRNHAGMEGEQRARESEFWRGEGAARRFPPRVLSWYF